MDADELRGLMKATFHGVTLDGGIGLRQGEVCDNYGKNNDGREISEAEFASISHAEITNDWTAVSLAELEQYPYLAYLDAEGFRYYIPAFLTSLLPSTDGASMRMINTSRVCGRSATGGAISWVFMNFFRANSVLPSRCFSTTCRLGRHSTRRMRGWSRGRSATTGSSFFHTRMQTLSPTTRSGEPSSDGR